MKGRLAAALAMTATLASLAKPSRACSVCASLDPTLSAPGAEQPYARRLRLDVDALVGGVREAAPDGRLLDVTDVRLSATASYAPARDILVSLVLPALDRTLTDGARRDATWVPGDVEARVYGVAWRGGGRTFGLLAGTKLPTAPLERDARGAPLPAELEPGCSSIVPYIGAAYGLRRGMVSGQGSVAVYLPFSVRDAPHPGDSLRLSAWLAVAESARVATRFGAKVRVDGTGELSPGVADLSSGGAVGYVTSDVVVSPAEDLVLSAGAAFPVVQAWLGVHRETAMGIFQVAYDF